MSVPVPVDPPAINVTLEVSGTLKAPQFKYVYVPPTGATTHVDLDGTIHLEGTGPVNITFTVSAPADWNLTFLSNPKNALYVSKKNDPNSLRKWNPGNKQFLDVLSAGKILAVRYAGCTKMGNVKTPYHSYKLNLQDATGKKVISDPKIQNGSTVLTPREIVCDAEV